MANRFGMSRTPGYPVSTDDPVLNPVVTPKSVEPRKLTMSEHLVLRTEAKKIRKRKEMSRKKREVRDFLEKRQLEMEGQRKMDEIYSGQLDGGSTEEDENCLDVLLTRPHPFDIDIPSDNTVRSSEKASFETYLESKNDAQLEADYYERVDSPRKYRKLKKLKMDVTEIKEEVLCVGCGLKGSSCLNLRFGRFCQDAVRQYQRATPNKYLQGIVAKKIFIDHYNYMIKFDRYRPGGTPDDSLASLQKEEWVYPPACVLENSYFYILKWLDWVKHGKWSFKKSRVSIPTEFHKL